MKPKKTTVNYKYRVKSLYDMIYYETIREGLPITAQQMVRLGRNAK